MSLKSQTISGILWGSVGKVGILLVQFVLLIILGRILSPYDYGVIGILSFFTLLSNVIIESGFGQALIRREKVTDLELSSVFYLNLFLGVFLYVILLLLSECIALFFNIHELQIISKVFFLIIPVNALGIIQTTLFNKKMEYRKITFISFTSILISGICSVVFAVLGFGVWALVFQLLIYSITNTLFLWLYGNWKPLFVFSFHSIKGMLPFSINMLFTGVVIVIFNNLYTIIIGKYYSPLDLGYYTQGKKIEDIPSQSLTMVIQNVSYSALSKLQKNNMLLKESYAKIIRLSVFAIAPLLLAGIVLAPNMIPLFLSEKWLPVIPIFQILCVYGAFFPLHSISMNILKVKGDSKIILKLEILRRGLMLLVVFLTLQYDIYVLLWGSVFSSLLSVAINLYFCGRAIYYPIIEQLRNIFPYYFFSLLSCIVSYIVGLLFVDNMLLAFVCQSITFFFIYIFLLKVNRDSAYMDCVDIMKTYLKRKSE